MIDMDEYGEAMAHFGQQARASALIPQPQFGPEPPRLYQRLARLGFFDGFKETAARNLWWAR